jgi:hypothetical protein
MPFTFIRNPHPDHCSSGGAAESMTAGMTCCCAAPAAFPISQNEEWSSSRRNFGACEQFPKFR